ncbi:Lactose-binding lectin l-2 [Merluccius polli]|uniref:Lactose-binding lectin l-2 n=1 Tax=Merluccius polli TaxID=89951 RepID=A0AA47MY84_MERPO|nr:Lactose-binding lectin l-2 [Merluccius polli]
MYLRCIVLCGLLHTLALAGPPSQPSTDLKLQCGSCPMFWFNHDGRCYKYVGSRMTWADAELHCLSFDANLVSIHNEDENNFVVKLIANFDPTNGRHWIGFSDDHKDSSWMWSDGSRRDFYAWHKGEPNNHGGPEDCVEINFSLPSKWNDGPCRAMYVEQSGCLRGLLKRLFHRKSKGPLATCWRQHD